MGLKEQISKARFIALTRMRKEQAGQRFPTTMPDNFFPSQRWAAEHQRVSGLIGLVVPGVLSEVGMSPLEYSPRTEFDKGEGFRMIFHIFSLGQPSDWDLVRSPDSYEIRFLHEINFRERYSVVRFKGGQGVASSLLTEPLLREYIIERLSDPKIALPG